MSLNPRGVALLSASRPTFTQLIVRLALAACAVLLTTTVSMAQTTLGPGDIAFIAFNSDDGDDIAWVLLTDVNATTTIRISDNDWDGSSISENNYLTWTAGSDLDAGTVVVINNASNTNSGGETINVGSVTETGEFSIDGGNEEIWAYTGTGSDIVFLAAIANDNGRLNLSGSGLDENTSVFSSDDDDGIYYSGSRCVVAEDINDFSNWTSEGGSGNNILPISTTAFVLAAGSDALFEESFDDATGFTIASGTFFSDGGDDYIGIYDPTGSNDDFGSGSEPSGIQSFSNENGNYLVAEDIGKDGGSNPTELVWGPFNTSSYETCAKAIIAFAQDNMDSDDQLIVSFSTDGSNYNAGSGVTITGSQYWGSDNTTFTEYQFGVTLPQSSTTYVKLSIDSDGGDELGIDDFSIQGSVSCIPVTVTAFDATVQLSGSPVGVTVDATTYI